MSEQYHNLGCSVALLIAAALGVLAVAWLLLSIFLATAPYIPSVTP